MSSAPVASAQISDIDISNRLQPLNEGLAEELKTVIDVHGFILPKIALRRITNGAHGWVLVHGRHRLRALELLGLGEIIEGEHFERLDVSPGEARLIEIEENMARTDVTPLAQAMMLKAYRDTLTDGGLKIGRGGDRKSEEYQTRKRAGLIELEGNFTANAVKLFGLSSDKVERLLQIANHLGRWKGADGKTHGPEGLSDRLYFSPIGRNQSQLLKLAALPPEQLRHSARLYDLSEGCFDLFYAALSLDCEVQDRLLKAIDDGADFAAVMEAAIGDQPTPSDQDKYFKTFTTAFDALDRVNAVNRIRWAYATKPDVFKAAGLVLREDGE